MYKRQVLYIEITSTMFANTYVRWMGIFAIIVGSGARTR